MKRILSFLFVSLILTNLALAEVGTRVVYTASAPGYAGPVTVEISLNDDFTIDTLRIGDKEFIETPNIGTKVLEKEFGYQFIGKHVPLREGDVDTIAGATISSRAVIAAINAASAKAISDLNMQEKPENDPIISNKTSRPETEASNPSTTFKPTPTPTVRILPPEINNLANGGMMVRDAQRFYTQHTGKNSRFCLYQVSSGFGLGPAAMDQMRTDAKYSLYNNTLYFYSKSDGKVGLYAYNMKNGVASGDPIRIAPKNTLQYAIDDRGIYYATDGSKGIWRVDHSGKGKTLLSSHSVRSSNNVVRMIPYENKLFYINSKDNCLYNVSTSGSSNPVRLTKEGLHYFIFAEYKGQVIIIYVTYAKSDNLNYSTLRAISLDGSPIPALNGLSSIQARYINYLDGWLYYADSTQNKYLMALPLNNLTDKCLLLSVPVGYIHSFDGWITALPLESSERYFIDSKDWRVYTQPALY